MITGGIKKRPENDLIMNEILEELQAEYGLNKQVLREVIMSQFSFLKTKIEQKSEKPIRFKWLGYFGRKDKKKNWDINNIKRKDNENGRKTE